VARNVSQITIPVKYLTNTKALGTAQSKFAKFGGAVAGIAAASVLAVAKIGTTATKMASEFEDSFAKIQGLVGVSSKELGALEEAAARLGPQFGKSANEAADALFFITSAGLRGEEAINVLEASLKGAAIGLGDTKTIADLATSAVNAYGSETLNGAQAVDVLTEAVREGKLEPAELAGAMGQVLPIASALGVGFDEVGAAMAAMSRTGTDASQASTQLRGILNAVIKPTSEAEARLSELGLSAEGLREQMGTEGLLPTLTTLTDAFDGNIEATAEVFGNVRALTGVMDLMGTNVDGTRKIFANMTDGVGVLDDALEVTSNTVSFKFDRAMETAKAALLPVGNTLLDIASTMLDNLMPTIELLAPAFEETFAYLEEPLADLAALLPSIIEGLLPVLPVFGQLTAIITDLVVALMPVFMALLEALIPVFEFLLDAVQAFIVPLVELLAPILTKIIELFIPLIESILPIFLLLMDALLEPTLRLIEAFIPFYEAVLPLLADVIETIVVPALETFAEFLEVFLPNALAFLENAGLFPFLTGFEIFAAGIKNGSNGLQVTVAEMINEMIASFEEGVNSAIRAAKKIASALKFLPGMQAIALGILAIPEVAEGAFGRVEVPERVYDFPEVDVSGISDSAVRAAQRSGMLRRTPLLLDRDLRQETIDAFGERLGLTPRSEMTMRERAALLPFGGGQPLLPAPQTRAAGGRVMSGMPYLVGERGPELFMPNNDGEIIPNHGIRGSGVTYNITVNAGIGTDGNRVGEEIVRAIKRYERNSGPVFASA